MRKHRNDELVAWLVTQYDAKADYANLGEVRAALVRVFGEAFVPPVWRIAALERQARYLSWAKKTHVTPPRAVNQWRRSARATPEQRERSDTSLLREVKTRLRHLLLLMEAAAAQPNATDDEKQRVAELRVATRILMDIRTNGR